MPTTSSPGSSEPDLPAGGRPAGLLLAAGVAGALGVGVAVVFGMIGAGLASVWLAP